MPIRVSDLDRRDGFEETVLGYSAEEAQHEAGRCLDCDQICSLCVGVCPNVALMTYETAPVRAALPVLAVSNGALVADGSTPFVVDQRLQVAVLTDLLQRVRQLRDGLSHVGQAVSRQATPLPGPGGIRGAGIERLHARGRRGDRRAV